MARSRGVLEEANGRYGKSKFCPTELGTQIGIAIEERTNRYHTTYYAICYSRRAQEFLIANLQETVDPPTQNYLRVIGINFLNIIRCYSDNIKLIIKLQSRQNLPHDHIQAIHIGRDFQIS